jgi:hypothetical protein
MEPDPCDGNCFAVMKLINKLEKEMETWKEDAEFWKGRTEY